MRKITICALLAVIALFCALASSQLLGIDLSAENIKVAAVRAGNPFHIVVDEQAKRKIPLAIAFDDGSRHFGNNAIGFALRKPLDTYLYAQRLLGQSVDSQRLLELKESFGYTYSSLESHNRGLSVGIEAKDGTIFTPEELIAMSLQHVIKIAQDDGNIHVKDVVITIPHWFTSMEKTALLDAAELVGLHVMTLVTDTAASAVQYGLDRTWDNTTLSSSQNIVIVDIGASGVEMAYVQYFGVPRRSGTHKIAGHAQLIASSSDEHIGGHFIDKMLRDYFLSVLDERLTKKPRKDGITVADIKANPRALAKLLKAAQGAKVVLSANKEAKVNVDSIHKDIDLSLVLNRNILQELLNTSQLPPLNALVSSFLKECKEQITIQKIANVTFSGDNIVFDDVIVVGGSSRIPAIQDAIKDAFKIEKVAQTLNSDEAMVMGAVFIAANQSISFQTKPFLLTDINNGDVHVHIASIDDVLSAEGGEGSLVIDTNYNALSADDQAAQTNTNIPHNKHVILFPKHSPTYKRKTLTLTRNSDVVISINHNNEDVCKNCHSAIKGYTVGNITQTYTEFVSSEEAKHKVEKDNNLKRVAYNDTLSKADNEELYQQSLQVPRGIRVSLTFTTSETTIPRLLHAEALLDDWYMVDESIELNKKLKKAHKLNISKEKAKRVKEAKDAAANATATGAAPVQPVEEVEPAAFVPLPPKFILKKGLKRVTLPITALQLSYDASLEKSVVKIDPMAQTVNVNGFIPMKPLDFEQSRLKLANATSRDNARRHLAATRNTLETLIYTSRTDMDVDDAEDAIAIVTTEEQREAVISKANEVSEWLDEVGDDYSANDGSIEWYYKQAAIIQEQIDALKKLHDPIVYRRNQYAERATTYSTIVSALQQLTKLSNDLKVNKTWIAEPLGEFDASLEAENVAILAAYEAQQAAVQTDDPIWVNEVMMQRVTKLAEDLRALSKIPKPKAPKVTKEKGAKEDGSASSTDENKEDGENAEMNDNAEETPQNADSPNTDEVPSPEDVKETKSSHHDEL